MQSSYSEYSYAYAMVWLLNDTKMGALFLQIPRNEIVEAKNINMGKDFHK